MTAIEVYETDKTNMTGRFVVYDGEVWSIRGVHIASTGVRYLISSGPEFRSIFPEECQSCLFI